MHQRVTEQQAGVFAGRLTGAGRHGHYQLVLTADRERIPDRYTLVVSPAELPFERQMTWLH